MKCQSDVYLKQKKDPRRSGLELLRIIAMLMIVASHLSQRGNWAWNGAGIHFTPNQFLMNIIICFGQVGVAIFFAITGYFIYGAKHYNWKRLFNIARPTWFYSLFFLVVTLLFDTSVINFVWPIDDVIIHSIFPITTGTYWFVSAYVVLHLLIPYIKVWLDALNKKQLLRLILIIAAVSVIPNLLLYSMTDTSSAFFTFPSALFYAIVGYAVHRLKDDLSRTSDLSFFLIGLSGVVLYILSSLLIHFATTRFGYVNINNNILIDTMSLPCMLTAIPLVIIFSRQDFVNRFINYVAKLTFGVYLIHSNKFFIMYVWQMRDLLMTNLASGYSFFHFVVYFVATVLVVFCGCALVEAIRQVLTSILKKIIAYNNRVKE